LGRTLARVVERHHRDIAGAALDANCFKNPSKMRRGATVLIQAHSAAHAELTLGLLELDLNRSGTLNETELRFAQQAAATSIQKVDYLI
jgi:hypothetical protein